MSPSQLSCLATVGRDGPLSLGALAERERVAAPTMTGIVARLADDGLVERRPDPADGRSRLVSITDAGRDRVADVRERKNQWLRARLDELDADDSRTLLAAAEVMERLAASSETLIGTGATA
jgi:DNA-binding MarR family transcriptional regulator